MKQLLLIFLLTLSVNCFSANKYLWKAANGNMNWNEAGVWYTDSNHLTTTTTPTFGDICYVGVFTGTGILTLNTTANCGAIYFGGFAGTLAGVQSISANTGTVKFSAAMTLTWSGNISCSGSGAAQIVTAGKTILGGLIINGAGLTVRIMDNFTSTAATNAAISLLQGTLDFNNKNITLSGGLSSNGALTRTLSLGTGTIIISYASGGTIGSTYAPFDMGAGTNLTVSATTSTIRLTGNPSFYGGGKTYGRLEWRSATNIIYTTIKGANTFTDMIFTPTGTSMTGLNFLDDQICTDTMKIVGVSRAARELIRGKKTTDNINLSAGTYIFNYVDFFNIHLLSSTFDASALNVGNCGNNTGITFPSPVTRYAVMTTSRSWSGTNMWSTSNGGATGASIPIPGDVAVFTSLTLSANGTTLTGDIGCYPEIDFTNLDQTLAFNVNNFTIFTYGVNCANKTTASSGTRWIEGYNTARTYNWGAVSGIMNLDFLTATATFSGTNSSSGLNIYTGEFLSASNLSHDYCQILATDVGAPTLSLASYIFTLKNTSTALNFNSACTFNCGTSTVKITGVPATTDRGMVMGAVRTFYKLEFSPVTAPAVSWVIPSDAFDLNVTNELKLSPTARVKFYNGKTIAVGSLNATGTVGALCYINSKTTTAFIMTSVSPVCCNYLNIDYCTASGGTFYAGANGVNGGHNTNWVFSACPSGINFILNGTIF